VIRETSANEVGATAQITIGAAGQGGRGEERRPRTEMSDTPSSSPTLGEGARPRPSWCREADHYASPQQHRNLTYSADSSMNSEAWGTKVALSAAQLRTTRDPDLLDSQADSPGRTRFVSFVNELCPRVSAGTAQR